ncbi:MAG: ATP phosphoribosyltransferase regulatory subunit [Hyphomicrobium sp.]|nr:ATP phosphoribosyltransferase regulatory subunit [Hyphomicrobium sp.]
MPAETAKQFEALEAQAQKIMSVFIKAGYEAVSPAIIQPAGVFLDVIGEALRARTYVFTDPDGDELCLRPDLTVPTCRLHVERTGGTKSARYCYNGAAFRFQPVGSDGAHPREFRQAGIECFGSENREKAEARVVATIIEAIRSAGVKDFALRFGDLGLFRAVMDAIDLPDRARERLKHMFWRPDAFLAEMKRLAGPRSVSIASLPPMLIASLGGSDPTRGVTALNEQLAASGIEAFGTRGTDEVAAILRARVEDARAEAIPEETVAIIERYLAIEGPARAAGACLKDLMRDKGLRIAPAVDAYHARLKALADAGVDVVHANFSADFGRSLEYYTGFVFEVVVPGLGEASPVAGGGRYDDLLAEVGAPADVDAVGAAIHTERLLTAVKEARA